MMAFFLQPQFASFSDSIVEWLTTNMSGLPRELIVFLISMMPILELRGGLLAASILQVPYVPALLICIIGNILPIPFILLFIEKVLEWMKKTKLFRKFALWLERKATGEKAAKIRKVEFLGTLLFVGIPLPGTGAWTGSLIVSLLHVDRKKASIAIFLGVMLAAAIMSIITYLIPWMVKQFA